MPADIICIEPNSISEIPTARKVIERRIGFLRLERIERPSVVGIHEVNFFNVLEPTRISV